MRGHRIRALIALAAVAVMGLAACGDDDDVDTATQDSDSTASADDTSTDDSAEPAEDESAEPADDEAEPAEGEGAAPVVALADSSLGEILVDADGKTLYAFMNDSDGTSTCTADCAGVWPPLAAPAELAGAEGVDAALLGTTTRDDGTEQVTYGGSPLYTYSADAAPGDVNGQGVGDIWFVVGADGEPIESAPAEPAGTGGTDY